MSVRQDKATTDRFARTLRELVKRPENKVCADCKRNDPRWASWNLGVFLCIRCSGIHRGMGTHISKVKSVDLDVWTPEQMESIQKWGNHLANLYWEAHLKAGHVPPEHKMESFIRSKYESRRWALDGPPPADPSVLDNGASASASAAPPPPPPASATTPSVTQTRHAPSASFSSRAVPSPTTTTAAAARQPHTTHQLLSANYTNRAAAVPPAQPQPQPQPVQQPQQPPKAPENELFSLDFHAPSPAQKAAPALEPKKDVKQDILSLFSAPAPAPAPVHAGAGAGGGMFGNQSALWGGVGVAQQQHAPPAQLLPQHQHQQHQQQQWGSGGGGVWNGAVSAAPGLGPIIPAQPNVWGAPAASGTSLTPQQQQQQFQAQFQAHHQQYAQQQQQQLAQQQQQNSLFNTNAVWGAPASSATTTTTMGGAGVPDLFGSFGGSAQPAQQQQQQQKADDVFGDIWGGFK